MRIGEPIKDTAEITGLVKPTGTGTITFRLYSDEGCTVPVPGFSSPSEKVTENRSFTSAEFPTANAGLHYWIAEFSGDDNNKAVKTQCRDGDEVSLVREAQPAIKTSATATAIVGQTIEDTATLEGLVSAEGTGAVTFKLFDNDECKGTPVHEFTTASGISGSGTQPVSSDKFTTAKAGTYFWIASFAGDNNNNPIASKCLDPKESSDVVPTTPKIKTSATASAIVGQTLEDTATLEGLVNAEGTGKVTFKLFDNGDCEGTPVHEFTTATGISGSGTQNVSSDEFTTAKTGTYFWIASFAGDKNNDPIASKCLDANESSDVDKALPKVTTAATVEVASVGDKIKDVATLSGLVNPDGTGKVTFRLYSNHNCEGAPLFESTNPSPGGISANGPVSSDEHAIEAPGTYFWVASYSGDAHNKPASTGCGEVGESTVVEQAQPGITTSATSMQVVGGKIKDIATLSGLVKPTGTGTVTFKLYRDSECKSEVFSSTSSGIVTNGPVPSGEYPANAAGTYFWVASYSGDAHNRGVSSGCAAEPVVVDPAIPSLTTTPEPTSGVVGTTFKDKAVIGGLFGTQPGGRVSWTLYSKNDCSGKVASEGPISVSGNGGYSTPAGARPAKTGTYYWVVSYSGDANNRAVSSACAAEPIVAVDPGRASAHGPQACIATTAPVYVTGREIRSVTFYMDGPRRRIRTVAHSDKKGRYLIRIAARELSSHVHRVEMVVVFEPRSKTKPKTLRVLVARCPPPAPVFTG